MSLIKQRYTAQMEREEEITKKIDAEHVKPTDNEQQYAYDVIRIISERFSERLLVEDKDSIGEEILAEIRKECAKLDLSFEQQKRIEKTVSMTVLGQGPIDEFLQDPAVTDIIVQRYDNIAVERNGKVEKVDAVFNNEQHLRLIIDRIVQRVGRAINVSSPIVDARLKDGSRVNATIPPVSPDGATLVIRKFNQRAFSGNDYIKFNSLNREMLYFLERCVRGRVSIFVSGGTGSGKTSLLNMLSMYIPDNELIVTIEDTLELKLQQSNVRRMETRTTISENAEMLQVDQKTLVKAALRQRPDRIIVGEIRDGSVVDLVSAMSTGHEGSMSTGHANSPRNLCDVRIPILYSMNKDADFSERSIALQIAEAINLIVQIERLPSGERKITHISHVDGVREDDKVNIKDVFIFNKETKQFEFTGYIPNKIIKTIQSNGFDFVMDIFNKRES